MATIRKHGAPLARIQKIVKNPGSDEPNPTPETPRFWKTSCLYMEDRTVLNKVDVTFVDGSSTSSGWKVAVRRSVHDVPAWLGAAQENGYEVVSDSSGG